jgi:hypothetical protein
VTSTCRREQAEFIVPVDLTASIHQYLTSAPGSLFVQQPVEMVAQWQGDANLLWRVAAGDQLAVVKLFLDAGQARSRRQFDAHQLFAPMDLAPEPLWADRYPEGLSRQLIVYRWCAGEVIEPSDPAEIIAWSEAIATIHATSPSMIQRFSPHPVNLDYYWRIEQISLAQIESWLAPSGLALSGYFQALSTATAKLVMTSLPLWESVLPAPVHGDLTLQHSLMERGRVRLLDWEMFGLGDPALDVARLLQHESQTLTGVQVEQWLDRYLALMEYANMGQRIDVCRRLLEVHNVAYLLGGLRQQSEDGLINELGEVMTFLQTAITAALVRASEALSLAAPVNMEIVVADFITWLTEAAATIQDPRAR